MTPIPELPCLTDVLPGIGGRLKAEPSHFEVEEIPLYSPSGQGDHLYVTLTREGMNTKDLQERFSSLFHLKDLDVGFAGLKDRNARTTQTFSLYLPRLDPEEVARRIGNAMDVEIGSIARHTNRIKTGHLKGNRFRIKVTDVSPGALERAGAILEVIRERGFPNYYGIQRFGKEGDNADRGRRVLLGRQRPAHWLRKLLLSAYQSRLFNEWLVERMARGILEELLPGDLAMKCDTRGVFPVEDVEREKERLRQGEIVCSGPIFGSKMRQATGEPGELEEGILLREGIKRGDFVRARLDGGRRAAMVRPGSLQMHGEGDSIVFQFELPPGSYATVLLQEFMKVQPGEMAEGEETDDP